MEVLTALNHITLAVQDVERSFIFYRDVLGFTPLVKWEGGAYFLVGDLWFCLNLDPKRTASPCYTHYAFSVAPQDFEVMRERILSSGASSFQENSSPGQSFYFLDPDGHKLELHGGSWQERIKAKRADPGPWKNIEWFD